MSKIFNYNNPVLSSPVLWLRADKGVVVDVGGYVERWENQGSLGSVADAIQTTQANKPLLKLNGANNKPSLLFDGVNDFMDFSEISTIRSAFFVVNKISDMSIYAPLLGHPTLHDWTGSTGKVFNGSHTSWSILNGSGYVNGVSTPILSIERPLQHTVLSILTNGAPVTAQYITNERNANRFWNGNYSEIMLYDTLLPSEQRITIENYLKIKYGI